ncbi:hypothetical protein Pan216_51060 [Planctomycetes bacterium Pan216]|uniref:Uncharacterized protein n=1 Tax=Kolteria novifilia TaxID=2527975 RepID=A0A518BB97_9BACT|nr:hypothetical protein Pan216_51060 [Planctomycetes bacterium Pan216]
MTSRRRQREGRLPPSPRDLASVSVIMEQRYLLAHLDRPAYNDRTTPACQRGYVELSSDNPAPKVDESACESGRSARVEW